MNLIFLIGYSIVCCAAFSLGTFHTSSCAKKFKYKKFFQSEIILKETKRNFLECFYFYYEWKRNWRLLFNAFCTSYCRIIFWREIFREVLLIFAKKSRQGKFKCANWSKFPAKSLKYIQEKFFLAPFYQAICYWVTEIWIRVTVNTLQFLCWGE